MLQAAQRGGVSTVRGGKQNGNGVLQEPTTKVATTRHKRYTARTERYNNGGGSYANRNPLQRVSNAGTRQQLHGRQAGTTASVERQPQTA